MFDLCKLEIEKDFAENSPDIYYPREFIRIWANRLIDEVHRLKETLNNCEHELNRNADDIEYDIIERRRLESLVIYYERKLGKISDMIHDV